MNGLKIRKLQVSIVVVLISCLILALFTQYKEVNAAGIPVSVSINSNLSFENEVTGSEVPGWTTHPSYGTQTASVSTEQAYSGVKSMKFVDNMNNASLARVSEKFAISGNKAYTASAFVYLQKVGNQAQGSVQMWMIFYVGTVETTFSSGGSPSTNNEWFKMSVTGVAPPNATHVSIFLYSPMTAITTAYFDDVSVGETILNAGFEVEVPALESWTVSTGSTQSTVQKSQGSKSMKMIENSNAESSPVLVSSGARVTASAKVYKASGTEVSIELRFKDLNGNNITNSNMTNSFIGNSNVWTPLTVSTTAPTNAISVSVYLTTGSLINTIFYIDDVNLSLPIEYNLGVQVTNNPIDTVVFGRDASNVMDLMYVGSSGFPSKLAVYNALTGVILDQRELPNIEATWGMTVATDKSVYIGTANKNTLFRYVPGTYNGSILVGSALSTTILATGQEIIWDVSAGSNGAVYGGTSSSGKAFRYDPCTTPGCTGGIVTPLNNDTPIVAGLQFVRSIAYASDSVIYMGMGSTAQLIKFNPITMQKLNILPSSEQSGWVLGLDYVKNGGESTSRLFAKLANGSMVVLNTFDNSHIRSLSGIDSSGVSPAGPGGDNVYYTKGNQLYRYDISSNAEASLGDVGGSARGYTFVTVGGANYLYAGLTSGKILNIIH